MAPEKHSETSDSSHAKDAGQHDDKARGSDGHHGSFHMLKKKVGNSIIGGVHTLKSGEKEVREKRKQATYEPTHHWWQPPLSAWIPESNREILCLIVMYNIAIALLGKYTSFCGEPSDNDKEVHTFCSDDYILIQDKALNGFAVGLFLLLAFRANQAYDRFWEGRKNWGRLREVCRDFARLVCSHVVVETEDDFQDRRRAINFLTAFAAAVKLHLRKERDIQRDLKELDNFLGLQDVANIQSASHMPLFCQDILSDYLAKQQKSGKLTDYQMGVINTSCLSVMSDRLGSNERIANTPIPLSYVLMLRFFLILWLILYPLHVMPYYGWWSILLCSMVAFAVLGIESMACEIENPFGYDRNDLDLDAFVQGFYNDTQEILRRAEFQERHLIFDRVMVNEMSSKFHTLETEDV